MLIRFEVENFRSILDPVELTMVAVDEDRQAVRPAPSLGVGLLTVVGVFGPNASGKTNILRAFGWLLRSIRWSLRRWDEEIDLEPFAFGDGPQRKSSFTVEALVEDVRFEYLLDLTRERVEYEALFYYPNRRRKKLFEREGNEITFETGRGLHLRGARQLLTDRVLALTLLRRFDDTEAGSFTRSLLGSSIRGPLDRSPQDPTELLRALEEGDEENRERVLGLLRMADLGVHDLEIVDVPPPVFVRLFDDPAEDSDFPRVLPSKEVRLVHGSGEERRSFPLAHESDGTKAWLRLVGPVLEALRSGSVMLCDEIDASLHPVLTVELVKLFQDPRINPRGAQLIFTTHDTNLLNHLNRDEAWLTRRRSDGSTELGALADFAGGAVRRSANLEKAYLEGRFGALPIIADPALHRALGLTR